MELINTESAALVIAAVGAIVYDNIVAVLAFMGFIIGVSLVATLINHEGSGKEWRSPLTGRRYKL